MGKAPGTPGAYANPPEADSAAVGAPAGGAQRMPRHVAAEFRWIRGRSRQSANFRRPRQATIFADLSAAISCSE